MYYKNKILDQIPVLKYLSTDDMNYKYNEMPIRFFGYYPIKDNKILPGYLIQPSYNNICFGYKLLNATSTDLYNQQKCFGYTYYHILTDEHKELFEPYIDILIQVISYKK